MRHVTNTQNKARPVNAFNIRYLTDNFGTKIDFVLNFIILLIVMTSDIVDIDRAVAGDLWVVQESHKIVGALVNDQEDEWDKAPAKMSAAGLHSSL